MIAIGIDPGLRGAMVALDAGRRHLRTELAQGQWTSGSTYDERAMAAAVARCVALGEKVFFFLEEQHSQPGEGHRSIFTTAHGFGIWRGVTAHLVEQRMIVTPRRWQAVVHRGAPGATTKARSLRVARVRVAGLEDVTQHDVADAACLALYGLHVLGLDA